MPRQMWDREERAEYRKLYKEYKREGFDEDEARRLARQEAKEIMGNRLDFASDLYKNTLDDLN